MRTAISFVISVFAIPAFAESRELDAHEHGVGALNIAVESSTIVMEFHAPGADIVGFEHEATSTEDLVSIDEAVATLENPLELFVFTAAAGCAVTAAHAALESEEEHHDHDGHDDHDEHDDHKDHDDHDHDDHAKAEESHTEFNAEYTLVCADPSAISDIDFAYFQAFENAREVEVQIVTTSGAQAFEATRTNPKITLPGFF